MGCKYSRFGVPSKQEKCPPRVETAAGKRQTRQMSGHVTLSAVRGKKYAVLNLSIVQIYRLLSKGLNTIFVKCDGKDIVLERSIFIYLFIYLLIYLFIYLLDLKNHTPIHRYTTYIILLTSTLFTISFINTRSLTNSFMYVQ